MVKREINGKILLSMFAMLSMCVAISCDDNGARHHEPEPTYTLAGTSWKLEAFVDVESGVGMEPDCGERDCGDGAYTLVFVDDSIMVGRTVFNRMEILYSADLKNSVLHSRNVLTMTLAGDYADGVLYTDIFVERGVSLRFELYLQTLRIFYDNGLKYLKFNKIGDYYDGN